MKKNFLLFVFLMLSSAIVAEDGYRLWLRYDKIDNASLLQQYRNLITSVQVNGSSQTIHIAKAELTRGIEGLLGKKVTNNPSATRGIVAGTPATSSFVKSFF
jgi:alpha-glucuronidase